MESHVRWTDVARNEFLCFKATILSHGGQVLLHKNNVFVYCTAISSCRTYILCVWAKVLCLSCDNCVSHERNFCFCRRQIGFLCDKWNNVFVFCVVTWSCVTYKILYFWVTRLSPVRQDCRTYPVFVCYVTWKILKCIIIFSLLL